MTEPTAGVALTHLVFSQRTHPGLLRKSNEDASGASAVHHAFVICDGMGGAAAGEVASNLAVATFLESIATGASEASPPAFSKDRLTHAISAANHAVFRRSREAAGLAGMGTTLVAALFDPPSGTLWLAHVGDSRAYLFRASRLRLLTADHSMVEEQVRAGHLTREEADVSPVRHVITRAIGSHAEVEPEIQPLAPCPGDLLLLASDGLNRELTDHEIRRLLAAVPPHPHEHDLEAACQTLLDEANAHGGRDNVTVLLICLG